MEEDKSIQDEHVLSNTDLAYERTMLAENRTLMAWIRTAISMISFGFTIYKIFHEAVVKNPEVPQRLLTPRLVGMIMITFGQLGLIWGLLEHKAMYKKLRKSYPALPRSKTSVLALLILIFGLVLFLGALFRQ
jgi:putative membrane protein